MTTHCTKCGHPMVADWPTGDEHRRQRRTVCLDCVGESGAKPEADLDAYEYLMRPAGWRLVDAEEMGVRA